MKKVSLALFALFLIGCATSQINAANRTIVVGVDVFVTGAAGLDAARQAEEDKLEAAVKSGAMSPDAAGAEYEAWMAKGHKAAQALLALWDSLKSASHVVAAISAKGQGDMGSAIGDVLSAVQDAAAALAALGVKLPNTLGV